MLLARCEHCTSAAGLTPCLWQSSKLPSHTELRLEFTASHLQARSPAEAALVCACACLPQECLTAGCAQILICQNLRNNLQHPNEFLRGVTLRFLCRIREEEILEPLIPSILACLDHRHSYVRR